MLISQDKFLLGKYAKKTLKDSRENLYLDGDSAVVTNGRYVIKVTDSRVRNAEDYLGFDNQLAVPLSVLVAPKTAEKILKVLPKNPADLSTLNAMFGTSDNNINFECRDLHTTTVIKQRRIDQEFPNTEAPFAVQSIRPRTVFFVGLDYLEAIVKAAKGFMKGQASDTIKISLRDPSSDPIEIEAKKDSSTFTAMLMGREEEAQS